MKKIYRNIGIALGMFAMISCSDDPLQETDGIIGNNPNPNEEKLPPNEQWGWVGTYPGDISNSTSRLQAVEVKVRGDYEIKDLKLNSNPGYLQSTGLYVPPAEAVTVVLPGGAENLRYQIGIASWKLAPGEVHSRYENVSVDSMLKVGENIISSDFGGPLYFYFDGAPQSSEITLTVNGAVKSLDFILGETDINEWRTLVTDTVNPMIWGELIGKRVIMTLPVATLSEIERPDAFLEYYDELIEKDMDFFGGLSSEDFSMPWRIYSDIDLPDDAVGNSSKVYPYYPMGFRSNTSDSLTRELINLPMFELENKIIPQGIAALYASAWNSSDYIGAYIQEMPIYHMFQRRGRWNDIMPEMAPYLDPYTRKWMPGKKGQNNKLGEKERMTMVIQLVQEYGWDLLSYMSEKCREEIPQNVPDLYKNDLLAIYASEYAGVNLTEFFDTWGLPVSMYGRNYMKHYEVPTIKFWDKISSAQPKDDVVSQGEAYEKTVPTKDTLYVRDDWDSSNSTHHGTASAAMLLDGDVTTIWHTKWQGGSPPYPHWIQYEFKGELEFNYLRFVHRNHSTNPHAKIFKILYTIEPDSENWIEYGGSEKTFLLYADFGANGPVHSVYTEDIIKAYSVRIMFIDGYGGTNKNLAMAEFSLGLLK